MTKEEKILEILNSKPTQKIGLDDFYGKQTVLNMLKEAINYTKCSLQLKDKEVPTFEEWLKVNNYTKKNEMLYSKGISLIHKNILYKFYESEQNL
jgi:hypothetical protein